MNKNLDKKTNDLLDKLNKMPSLEEMGVGGARKFVAKAQADIPQDLIGIKVTEHIIAGVKSYYCEPENKKETDTVLVFVHGGGGTLSHWSDYQRMVRDIVVQSGIPCVFPEYTLAPEAKYPTQINECVDVCKELHSRQLKLALVGNSFGGGLVVGVAFHLQEIGIPVKCVVSMWPMCGRPYGTQSYYSFGRNRYLLGSDMEWFWHNYTNTDDDYNYTDVTPAENKPNWFDEFPPTFIQLCEEDPLRDEGLMLFRKMQQAAVDVTGCTYLGSIHDQGFLNSLTETNSAKKIIFDCAEFLAQHGL